MEASLAQIDEFIQTHRRAIMITYRQDGSLQTSPVRVGRDGRGHIVVTSRSVTAKVHNLARDPRVSLCVVTEKWSGGIWLHVDGRCEVIRQPEAMPLLEQEYRLREGKDHPDWEQFRHDMAAENRAALLITPTRAACSGK
ncbi:MAG TPA: TIGR03618 family F420-dependent PPOX class oxidoreductase [Chloroflexota bacterium]|nr:TIGR03618 family F420-dependent PPOX class oxidoreductase [Chloroflexota bacterium]